MLRIVRQDDLDAFYAHQRDPIATKLAAYPSRGRDAFDAQWATILRQPEAWVRTIDIGGEAKGYVCAFQKDGRWELAYWIGRAHWGQGIGAQAVAEFLTLFTERPVCALVAAHNRPSLRILEKAGFRFVGQQVAEDGIEEVVMTLDAGAQS